MHLITTVLLTLSWIVAGPVAPVSARVDDTIVSGVMVTDGPVAEAAEAVVGFETAEAVAGGAAYRCSVWQLLRKKKGCR